MSRRGWIVLIALAAIVLGALREFLFVNLNYQIDHVERATDFSYAHTLFQGWVQGWGLPALQRAKWALALGFIGAMLGLAIGLARLLAGDHRHARALALGYAAAGGLALLLHAAAPWQPPLEAASVQLLHMLQYPVVLFFFWAGWTLKRAA
jgi:hypothetical protein